ncbi:ATP-dependent Clp protease adapter ClpS [soil metagenome]
MSNPAPTEVEQPESDVFIDVDKPWVVIVWNDPVNLMSYVAYVFRSYFGYTEEKAKKLMMQVHGEGKAVVASGGREEMERHVQAMHEYGLWATLERS